MDLLKKRLKQLPRKQKLMIALATLLFLIALLTTSDKERLTEMERPGYKQSGTKQKVVAEDASGNTYEMVLPIEAKTVAKENLQQAFDETFELLCKTMRGENSSLDCVTEDLSFPGKPGKYGMKAMYMLSDYSVVSPLGVVKSVGLEKSHTIEATITLIYGEYSQEYKVPITIIPKAMDASTILINKVLSEIELQNGNGGANVLLPTEIDGEAIKFYVNTGTRSALILCSCLLGMVYFYYRKFALPRKKKERREELLRADYAELVSKISLLVGSGMSVRNAITKIAQDFDTHRVSAGRRKDERPAYEELLVIVRRMEAGVSQQQAYWEYGRACCLHCYIRLAELLSQGVRKGNSELLKQLEEETAEAFEERKAQALREGEKAGTKLVIPMIMMLIIVFIIIIVPAFQTMT